MQRRKKRLNTYLLLILLLGVSVGFALLSTTLKINGTVGVQGGVWDIHWDDTTIQRVAGSVEPTTEAHVIDQKKQIISFNVELELPGDFYEFTVNAINEGTINGIINDIRIKFQDENDQDIELPNYIKYELKHTNGTAVEIGQVLEAGKSDGYRFRLEFDRNLEELPETVIPTIKPTIEIDYGQTREEDTRPNIVTLDTNGGSLPGQLPTTIEVPKNQEIGTLPIPEKQDDMFDNWYTDTTSGIIVGPKYVPQSDITIHARYTNSYAVFDTGSNVNVKLKTLAGDTIDEQYPVSTQDTNVTSIVRSDTAPAEGTTTEIVSVAGEDIIAWYENGTIKLYSAADNLFLNADASSMFSYFKSVTSIYTGFRTDRTTNMAGLFNNCSSLSSLDVSGFDTSRVTNMNGMFGGTAAINLDLSNFDTRNVTTMSAMFSGTRITSLDLSSFDTSNVTVMSAMFASTSLTTLNVSSFNTSNVTNMASMFAGSGGIISLNLSSFDVSKVTNFGGMFGGCGAKTLNISGWNFDSITSLEGFFGGMFNVESIDFTDVNTSKITNMYSMFGGLSKLKNLDLSSFDTTRVTNMSSMFGGCSALTSITVSDDFSVDAVTIDGGMFYGDTSLVGGAGTPYDQSHIDKGYAHYDEGEDNPGYFNAKYDSYFTITFNANGGTVSPASKRVGEGAKIKDMPTPERTGHVFLGWYTQAIGGTKITANYTPTENKTLYAHWEELETMFDTGRVVNVKMKYLSGTLNDKTNLDAASDLDNNVTSIERTTTAPDLNQINYEIVSVNGVKYPIYAWYDNGKIYWYTEANVAFTNPDASYMFCRYGSLTNLDTDFDTSLTTNMVHMLADNTIIEHYDLSHFNTSNVTTVQWIFHGCQSLKELDLSTWDTTSMVNMNSMFCNTYAIETLDMSNWDFSKISLPNGYFLSDISAGGFNSKSSYQIKEFKLDNAILPSNMYAGFAYLSADKLSLKNVDTSKVTDMFGMFEWVKVKNLDLTSFDTSKVTTMYYMFANSDIYSVDVSSFDTRRVTSVRQMFMDCDNLVSLDVSNFEIGHISTYNIGYFIYDCESLVTLNLSNLDFSNYTESSLINNLTGRPDSLRYLIMDNVKLPASMASGIYGMDNVEYISMNNIDTSRVTNMNSMFSYNKKLKQLDLTSFDTSNVTDMDNMFSVMNELTTIYTSDNFVVNNVTTSNHMFYNSTNIVGGAGTVYDSNHLDKEYAHYDGGQSNPGYFTRGNTSTYTINFNANGGNSPVKIMYVTRGDELGYLPTPIREGYIFTGWYTGLTDGTRVTKTYTPSSNMTLYARWARSGWYFENENDFGPDGEPLTDQKWQYYEDGVRIENGLRELNGTYRGSTVTMHNYLFVNGYMYIGWYEENNNKYFFSWFDKDHNGLVEGHRYENISDTVIEGKHYSFDANGVATEIQ